MPAQPIHDGRKHLDAVQVIVRLVIAARPLDPLLVRHLDVAEKCAAAGNRHQRVIAAMIEQQRNAQFVARCLSGQRRDREHTGPRHSA
jgi:hypothetical protein